MALTKESQVVDVWEETAQDTIRIGAIINVDPNFDHVIHIDHANTSETGHNGTEIIVWTSSSDAADEFWTRLTSFIMGAGTAASEPTDDNPLTATSTTVLASDTTGFEFKGKQLFLKDLGTFANSELVYQTDFTSNTDITIAKGVTRSHAQSSTLYNIAETQEIQLPPATRRFMVFYNNTIDSGGSTIATRTRLVKITAVS